MGRKKIKKFSVSVHKLPVTALETLLYMFSVFVESTPIAETITRNIKVAIRAYSMAVAPFTSFFSRCANFLTGSDFLGFDFKGR